MGVPLAAFLALVAAGTWALASHLIARILAHLAPDRRPSPAAINLLRCTLALLGFGVLWALLGGARPSPVAWLGLIVSGALGFALGDHLYFAALPRVGVQTSAVIGLANVPLAALGGWLWLDQPLPARVLVSMGVVLAGVLLVLCDGSGTETKGGSARGGHLLALGAAISWAAATLGGHAAMQGAGVFVGAFGRLLGALLGALLLILLVALRRGGSLRQELHHLARPFRSPSLLSLLAPAVLCASLLNLIPFHFALQALPGAIGALLFSCTPLFTLPLAPLFGEVVGLRTLLGTGLGLLGVAGVILSGGALQSPTAPPPALRLSPVAVEPIFGALAPDLVAGAGGELALSYLLPGPPARLEWRSFDGDEWSEGRELARGAEWFVNWADTPQLALREGGPVATWLEKLGEGTFAYGVRLRDATGEVSWLHRDRSPVEHGFVSLVALGGERLFAVWLDGRNTHAGEEEAELGEQGAMSLRARLTDGREVLVDPRTCDCCQTDAGRLADGRVLVAWRDRSEEEVRDIYWTAGDPSAPLPPGKLLYPDRWQIEGCPVNGPAVATGPRGAAIAWFTVGGGEPRVQVAFAAPDLSSFGEPLLLSEGEPLGRVDACWLGDYLVVCWLERDGLDARWRARAVAPEGRRGPLLDFARVSGRRDDGFARMARQGRHLVVVYRDGEEDLLRTVLLDLPSGEAPARRERQE